ncbi:Uncharacterised protein [Mycolicibacterium phlei]|jgi:hypothetical protein|uniref:Secreted protein n=1 Tax=Mycolicibacterium phlei DSM 43239 = CCUG 21000 TaxID=1226750 RepID=A0A5N5UZM1_MYCPH|nr:hypothetical protein [Mycolicibacterium phlei]VEG10620.1 Uncharacterised protein [Mycobacteroides chelonae]AMO62519.1 hypothetical protein MPHLCCUG_03724 [Mycolicibacterium phlei]EID11506.1 hypothetical protein MPHLEI_18555 [Mycolicibacterium phlei RIVM601174]KAB7755082.1 hypothetical protein MPHL21000_14255 [Mycolicibacterium phlei DSM 43239 = CCUG 21000]KXW61566.1 hypothetical protein MPHL43239_20150 [Mycolicibacterium phlei DSM 43239 = CCUG 21000]
MKSPKLAAVMSALLLAVGMSVAAPANADMQVGNYDLLTNRYDRASWVWFITPCYPDRQPNCRYVSARPRLKYYAYYEGEAHLADGRYTMTVDVIDGLRCPGYNLPTRETYTWDEVSLAGTIESHYDVGCFNGPPGMQFWTFALQRL